MLCNKLILGLLFFFLAVTYASERDLELGSRAKVCSEWLPTKVVKIKADKTNFFNIKNVEKDLTFTGNGKKIIGIKAINTESGPKLGSVSVVKGGIGYKSVTLKFEGKLFSTVKYDVTLNVM